MVNFNKRQDMIYWFTRVNPLEAKQYFIDIMNERIKNKKIINTLCQVELRSLKAFPSIIGLKKILNINNYYDFCQKTFNLKSRFIDIDSLQYLLMNKVLIDVDTREKQPLFEKDVLVTKLNFGDYKLYNGEKNIYFERKSLTDFIGTFSRGFSRFRKEIQRAKNAGQYLIIIVEYELEDCLNFKHKHLCHKDLRITPEYLFHNVRSLIQTYDNIQFVFVKNRQRMIEVMLKISVLYTDYRTIDLQLAYDLKMI